MAPWQKASSSSSGDTLARMARDLLQAQLPGQYHAAGAQIVPSLGADVIGDRLLGADVPLAVWRVLPRQGERAQVRQDQGVHPRRVQLFQMGRQGRPPHSSGAWCSPWRVPLHRGRGQTALPSAAASSSKFPAKERIPKDVPARYTASAPYSNRHLQLFPVPGRGQQLRLFHLHHQE